MATIVRLGKLVVDLEKCVMSAYANGDDPRINVYFLSDCFTFSLKHDPAEYRALSAYMDAQMPLETYNLRIIRENNFDPFLPYIDELASALFSEFSALPGSCEMVLSLMADGTGGIWQASESDQCVENALVRWLAMDEALESIAAYRASVSQPKPNAEE